MTHGQIVASAFALLCIASACLGQSDFGQDGEAPTTEQATEQLAEQAEPAVADQIAALPTEVRPGAWSQAVAGASPIASVVVIVPDEHHYYEAIRAWQPKLRFPVLIDDGSPRAHEDIARFVRGFQPEQILVWPDPRQPQPEHEAIAVVEHAELAMTEAWDMNAEVVKGSEERLQAWELLGVRVPGVVVTSERDPARIAAVALAAGRGQPLVWVDRIGGSVNGKHTEDKWTERKQHIMAEIAALGLPWRALGDRIDAVTLCLNEPTQHAAGVGSDGKPSFLAVTDSLPRLGNNVRWGYASMIFGDEARAAYVAMSSLYLSPTSAVVVDPYPDEGAWQAYNGAATAEILQRPLPGNPGIDTELLDDNAASLPIWRRRVASPVDAGLVFVNTMGNADRFRLRSPGSDAPTREGTAWASDVPMLSVPAVVHFTHSWSAQRPGQRGTLAGRWMERGAYAYAGSIQEPLLTAFVPTPELAQRWRAGIAWAILPRHVQGPAWKINVFGDALMTGITGPQLDIDDLGFAVGADIDDLIAVAAGDRDLAETLRLLVLSGQDEKAARLLAAAFRDRPESVTPSVARAALMAAFRMGDRPLLLDAFERLDEASKDAMVTDALWLAAAAMPAERRSQLAKLLDANIRPNEQAQDRQRRAEALAN
ncbi:MAG: hypothetical protein AAF747_01660 [Planctomycetota bacterium]